MFNDKVFKRREVALYSMPSLEDDRTLQSPDAMLEKAGELQRKAYEEGFSAGEKAGFSEGRQKALVLTERLEAVLKETAVLKEQMISDAETQLVALAAEIARRVVIEEVGTRPELIVTMVREALKRLQRVGKITIKINPALHDLFIKKTPEIMEIHENIIFDVDAHVPVTGPLVISETEEVVTDIDSLLSNIIEEMKNTENRTKNREP